MSRRTTLRGVTLRVIPWRLCLRLSFVLGCAFTAASPRAAAPPDARELYTQLDRVAIDPAQVYVLRHARIARDRINIYFQRGFVGFFQKVSGEITGAFFNGEGEVLLMPPSEVERQSLAMFTGSPILEEQFTSAYLRFTDQTAKELLSQARRPDPDDPEQPDGFVDEWRSTISSLNPAYSLRVLEDLIGDRSRPYFTMVVQGVHLGGFELTDDRRAAESVTVKTERLEEGREFVDVWCALPGRASTDLPAHAGPARPLSFKIETRIDPDNTLSGRTTVELESQSATDRLLFFRISRALSISQANDSDGRRLEVFQSSLPEDFGAASENQWVAVALAAPHPIGERYRLTFDYHGDVVTDVGNGVLFVGSRGSWYPNTGAAGRASYDLTFRYPARLTLVATGQRVSVQSSGEWTKSRWVSDHPFFVAGFNLGVYAQRGTRAGTVPITAYATQAAEDALEQRYLSLDGGRSGAGGAVAAHAPSSPSNGPPALDPAALLDLITARAARAVAYYSKLFGPFPFPRFEIAQAPSALGQSWPELVYLPTLAFLPAVAQEKLGIEDLKARTILPHEIAHQWWGNLVGWKTYHDEWLSEGLATYAAALFVEHEQGDHETLHHLLEGYKQDLLAKTTTGQTVESGGPIWLGERLTNSLNPQGFREVVYKKACWVFQMLRMLMRDPRTGSDEQFFKMLAGFAADRDKSPSTQDFIEWASRFMTPMLDLDHNHSLGWFFKEWVYGTAIPSYQLTFKTARSASKGYVVSGTIEESGVPEDFEMLVPLVAVNQNHQWLSLGLVRVGPDAGKFQFVLPSEPERVEIDENNILAIVPDQSESLGR